MVQGIFMYFWNFIFSKSIWKDCYCIKTLCFSLVYPGEVLKVSPPEERTFHRKSLQILLFCFVHGFSRFLKAFILYTNDNIWHYEEAKSSEGRIIFSIFFWASYPYKLNQRAPCTCLSVVFANVLCPVPFVWNITAFFILKRSFLGQHRSCCL